MIYLHKPSVNKFSSKPVSKSSLDDIMYKNLDLKNATIKRTEVFKPIVFLKTSIKIPIMNAYINNLKTVVSSRCFNMKKENIKGLK